MLPCNYIQRDDKYQLTHILQIFNEQIQFSSVIKKLVFPLLSQQWERW